MKNMIAVVLVVLVLGGVGWFLLGTRSDNSTPHETADSEMAALQRELKTSKAQQEETARALAEAQARNEALESEVAEANEAALAVEAESEADAKDDKPEKEDEARKRSLDEIRERLKNNPAASAQIKALTELMYADLLNSLDLTPAEKSELRALLTDSLMESMSTSRFALLDGEFPWSEVRGWELEERAYLDAKIRELLPPEQIDTWNDYFADIDARQLEGNLRNQIAAVANGLTQENFDYVLQVAVEEFRAQQIALEQSNQPFTIAENINYQLRAMQSMRERLAAMPPDQLAEIENWLTMAERLLSGQLAKDQ